MRMYWRWMGLGIAIGLGSLAPKIMASATQQYSLAKETSSILSNAAIAKTITNNTPADIEAAYTQAVRTGQFRTQLSPYVHPDLQNDIDSYWLFRPEAADTSSTIQSTVRPANADDIAVLERHYQQYITPTHVIEVEVSQPEVTNGITGSTIPIYIQQTADSWYIVFGTDSASQAQVESSLAQQQLIYHQDTTGPWQHHWDLQFDLNAPYRYSVQLRDTQANEVIETFVTGAPEDFNDGQRKIRFWLQPEGATTAHQALPQGSISLPYGYQIGNQATTYATHLPLNAVTRFTPQSNLRFEGDRLLLAQINGQASNHGSAATKATLAIEVVRTAIR